MRLAAVALVLLGLLAVAVAPGSAGAASVGPADGADRDATDSTAGGPIPAPCFPPNGHEFVVGTEGPRIDLLVHTSLVTNLGGPGAFGVEAAGSTGRHRIVALEAGVLFAGVGDPARFLRDPLARFSIAFRYEFRVPMVPGLHYELDELPVVGPVGAADCYSVPAASAGSTTVSSISSTPTRSQRS
ncbi:DUF7332 family protein [Halegenticoccus soli]|uniref:DUF7332 family protein n=1 Tax=Halegenticoccus soli TaxID=1985678 RepID=UPI0018EC0E44|nr:hypothetical protein [Halegenticoccus soli]